MSFESEHASNQQFLAHFKAVGDMPEPVVKDLRKAPLDQLREEVEVLRLFVGQLFLVVKEMHACMHTRLPQKESHHE